MVFNLKKQGEGFGEALMPAGIVADLILPPGVEQLDAQYLWNNVYKNAGTFASAQDMVNALGADGLNREITNWINPDQVADAVPPAQTAQDTIQQLQTVLQKSKPFNIKTAKTKVAQEMMAPPEPMPMETEMPPDMMQPQQEEIPQPPFAKMEQFKIWLDATDNSTVLQALTTPDGDTIKQLTEQYFTSQDEGDKGILAAQIFNDPSFSLREEQGVMAQPRSMFTEVDKILKKIARNTVNKNKKKSYNLKKTAQHKTMDNAILWGPGQTRIDPFLHQPVSDWHIVERNKGFGLVVDDIWNIDYETIWRENIMDKYSRPYKDAEGNWVGGYIQKRFEVDKNIPETSNYQLKPGQIRKPVLPEYGITESRLQSARAAGDIEGANDKSKPFNWKEAATKKKR